MAPSSNVVSSHFRQRTSRAMSLSSLSSALGIISSPETISSSKTHKRKESFRGEAFVSSFDEDGSSSLSSEKSKNIQEDPIPALLGEHESATASSSAFPSLAVSGSSLSSGPHLAMTVSRSSAAVRELTNGIQSPGGEQQEEQELHEWDSDGRELSQQQPQDEETGDGDTPMIVLENVEYVTSFPVASPSCTDLSSMEQHITKEMAKPIFSRRIVPSELQVNSENQSDVSTINGGKHIACDTEGNVEVDVDVEQGQADAAATTTTAAVEVEFPWYHNFLERRSPTERFFLAVIGISATILVILLVIVLR